MLATPRTGMARLLCIVAILVCFTTSLAWFPCMLASHGHLDWPFAIVLVIGIGATVGLCAEVWRRWGEVDKPPVKTFRLVGSDESEEEGA